MNSESHLSELRKFMTDAVPFWHTLGLELKEVAPGRAVFEAAALPSLMQNKLLHGGVLASIADSACAVAAILPRLPGQLRHHHQLAGVVSKAGHTGSLSRRRPMP
jgi:acyl-coenzyme A thioesterase PaaI-like protein